MFNKNILLVISLLTISFTSCEQKTEKTMENKDKLTKKMTNDELLEHLFTKKGAKHIKEHVKKLDTAKEKKSKKVSK